jgi:hypothetical protein
MVMVGQRCKGRHDTKTFSIWIWDNLKMFKPWSLRLLQVHHPYHKHRSIEYVPIPHRVIILQRLISTSIAFTSCTRWQTRVSEREFAIDSPFAPFVIPDCCNILSALKSTIFIVHGSNATTKSSSVSNECHVFARFTGMVCRCTGLRKQRSTSAWGTTELLYFDWE